VKKIIVHEMLGRVVKNKLRARLREVNSTSELTQNVYRKCVLEFLNLLLGQDQLMVREPLIHLLLFLDFEIFLRIMHSFLFSKTQSVVCFWQKEMKEGLRTQFSFVLENDTLRQLREDKKELRSRKEEQPPFHDDYDDDDSSQGSSSSDELEVDLSPFYLYLLFIFYLIYQKVQKIMKEEDTDELYLLRSVDMYKLFKRIEQLTGVTFSKQSKRELKSNSRGFKLVVPDIVKMSAKVLFSFIFYMNFYDFKYY
jgi:hypothetical protein